MADIHDAHESRATIYLLARELYPVSISVSVSVVAVIIFTPLVVSGSVSENEMAHTVIAVEDVIIPIADVGVVVVVTVGMLDRLVTRKLGRIPHPILPLLPLELCRKRDAT